MSSNIERAPGIIRVTRRIHRRSRYSCSSTISSVRWWLSNVYRFEHLGILSSDAPASRIPSSSKTLPSLLEPAKARSDAINMRVLLHKSNFQPFFRDFFGYRSIIRVRITASHTVLRGLAIKQSRAQFSSYSLIGEASKQAQRIVGW